MHIHMCHLCFSTQTLYPMTPPCNKIKNKKKRKKSGHYMSCLPSLVQSGLAGLAVSFGGKWSHALGILLRKNMFMLL